jgi:ribosomal protein S18 acetylase RimI-like enzyme
MRIRELGIEDYERLLALWREAGLPFRPRGRDRREAMAKELEGASATFLVAEEGGRLVGSVLATDDGRKGWINRLAVLPSQRRIGLAQRLVAEAEARLQRKGIAIIACLIEEGNAASEALFSRIGYVRHPEIVYYAKRLNPDV